MCYADGMAEWNKGKKPWNWTGKPVLASNGYVLVHVGKKHHLADVRGYAYEHRVVAEKKLGRRLRKREQVHHLNGRRADNSIDNIVVMKTILHHRVEHRRRDSRLRRPGDRNPLVCCECGCRTKFRRFDSSGRPRRFVSGHNN